MRRRMLLVGFAGLAAGCLGDNGAGGPAATTTTSNSTSPATNTQTGRRTATPTDDNANAYRIENLELLQETDGPKHRYVLAPIAFYSESAVEREEKRTVRDLVVEFTDDIKSRRGISDSTAVMPFISVV